MALEKKTTGATKCISESEAVASILNSHTLDHIQEKQQV